MSNDSSRRVDRQRLGGSTSSVDERVTTFEVAGGGDEILEKVLLMFEAKRPVGTFLSLIKQQQQQPQGSPVPDIPTPQPPATQAYLGHAFDNPEGLAMALPPQLRQQWLDFVAHRQRDSSFQPEISGIAADDDVISSRSSSFAVHEGVAVNRTATITTHVQQVDPVTVVPLGQSISSAVENALKAESASAVAQQPSARSGSAIILAPTAVEEATVYQAEGKWERWNEDELLADKETEHSKSGSHQDADSSFHEESATQFDSFRPQPQQPIATTEGGGDANPYFSSLQSMSADVLGRLLQLDTSLPIDSPGLVEVAQHAGVSPVVIKHILEVFAQRPDLRAFALQTVSGEQTPSLHAQPEPVPSASSLGGTPQLTVKRISPTSVAGRLSPIVGQLPEAVTASQELVVVPGKQVVQVDRHPKIATGTDPDTSLSPSPMVTVRTTVRVDPSVLDDQHHLATTTTIYRRSYGSPATVVGPLDTTPFDVKSASPTPLHVEPLSPTPLHTVQISPAAYQRAVDQFGAQLRAAAQAADIEQQSSAALQPPLIQQLAVAHAAATSIEVSQSPVAAPTPVAPTPISSTSFCEDIPLPAIQSLTLIESAVDADIADVERKLQASVDALLARLGLPAPASSVALASDLVTAHCTLTSYRALFGYEIIDVARTLVDALKVVAGEVGFTFPPVHIPTMRGAYKPSRGPIAPEARLVLQLVRETAVRLLAGDIRESGITVKHKDRMMVSPRLIELLSSSGRTSQVRDPAIVDYAVEAKVRAVNHTLSLLSSGPQWNVAELPMPITQFVRAVLIQDSVNVAEPFDVSETGELAEVSQNATFTYSHGMEVDVCSVRAKQWIPSSVKPTIMPAPQNFDSPVPFSMKLVDEEQPASPQVASPRIASPTEVPVVVEAVPVGRNSQDHISEDDTLKSSSILSSFSGSFKKERLQSADSRSSGQQQAAGDAIAHDVKKAEAFDTTARVVKEAEAFDATARVVEEAKAFSLPAVAASPSALTQQQCRIRVTRTVVYPTSDASPIAEVRSSVQEKPKWSSIFPSQEREVVYVQDPAVSVLPRAISATPTNQHQPLQAGAELTTPSPGIHADADSISSSTHRPATANKGASSPNAFVDARHIQLSSFSRFEAAPSVSPSDLEITRTQVSDDALGSQQHRLPSQSSAAVQSQHRLPSQSSAAVQSQHSSHRASMGSSAGPHQPQLTGSPLVHLQAQNLNPTLGDLAKHYRIE